MRCSAAACLLRLKGSSAPEAARARAWPEALPNGASAFARSSIFVMPLPRVDLTRGAAYDPRRLIDPIPHRTAGLPSSVVSGSKAPPDFSIDGGSISIPRSRSEEHKSELQSQMRIPDDDTCL